MYDFGGNEELKNRFFDSIDNGDVQYVSGTIRQIDKHTISFIEGDLLDNIRYDCQCTEDEDTFNFGGMYVGSVELKIKISDQNTNLIRGGELWLYFWTEKMEERERIPLGVWDIVSAEYEAEDILTIKGYDRLNRLNTPTMDSTIGCVLMSNVFNQVEKVANVKFKQSIEELQELFGEKVNVISNVWGTKFLDTCWNEVRNIAQFLGGFAFADRNGKIEFRKFSSKSVMVIPAEKRFSAKINDYQYKVLGVSYTDCFGNTVQSKEKNFNGTVMLGFSDNKYIWDEEQRERAEKFYSPHLNRLASALNCSWTPGTIEYYGNPALDVGDMVSIAGGVNGERTSNFLITHISWQFRGPQRLVSAGMPETSIVASSGGSSGGTVTSYTTVNTTRNISAVELRTYTGEVFGSERTVAKGGFSCGRETWAFVDCTLILSGDGLVSTAVCLDGIAQTLRPKITLHDGEYSTFHFTLPLNVSGGTHQVRIVMRGTADISDIQSFVWGQEVKRESPEITDENDYLYTVNDGITTVTGYTGKSLYPQIPDDLGGGRTTYIGKTSFTDSAIESVYIPDGVTEIQ